MEMGKGEGALKTIRFVKEFLNQVSLVLQDADRLMAESGWECVHGNLAIVGSNSLEAPHQWMPSNVFRFYCSTDEASNTLACISVLLDDRKEQFIGFTEPLLSAAVWTFDPETSREQVMKRKVWGYSWCRSNGEREFHDGRICPYPRDRWPVEDQESDPHCLGDWCFGYPLVEFSSAADIEEKVVKPLLELIEKAEEESKK
jgi:hypothetical protein